MGNEDGSHQTLTTSLAPAKGGEAEQPAHAELDAIEDDDTWEPYHGEIKRRHAVVACALTLLAPGLGYVYVGRFMAGLMVNLAYWFSLFFFTSLWMVLKFFPLLPAGVLIVGWAIMFLLIMLDLIGRCRLANPYVMAATNHWLIYALVAILTFWLPLGITLETSSRVVWQRTWAGNDAMYPTVLLGDLVLVDRTSYLRRSPGRGELVLVEEPGDPPGVYFARVIGIAGDRVHMEGYLPWVNGHALSQRLWGGVEDQAAIPAPFDTSTLSRVHFVVEAPHGLEFNTEEEPPRWYLLAVPARPTIEPTEPVELGPSDLFVLADNRMVSFARAGERNGGRVIQRTWVVGRPLFILYSLVPGAGHLRRERIGLRLR